MLSVEARERIAKGCADVEAIRRGHGQHAGHARRFVEPHWIVCSCGGRAVATEVHIDAMRLAQAVNG